MMQSNPFSRSLFIALLIAMVGLFLFTTRSAYQSGDSLKYAWSARTGDSQMFHPHHLIFTPLIHVLYRAGLYFSPKTDPLTTGQLHNIAWAIVVLISLYFIVHHLTRSKLFALSAAAVLFATQGFLTYTTWFEVYMPALGCLSLLTVVLLRAPSGRLNPTSMALVISFLSLGILYHQTNVLFIFPLGLYFVVSKDRIFRDYLILVVSSGVIVFLLYVSVYLAFNVALTPRGFLQFCLAYAAHPNPTWGTWENFGLPGIRNLINSQIWNILELPLHYERVLRLLFVLFVALVMGWNLRQAITGVKNREVRFFLLAWLFTYYMFFLWWLPDEQEFFLMPLLPLLVLASLTLHDFSRLILPPRFSPAAGVLLLVAISILLLLRQIPLTWHNHTTKGSSYQRAQNLAAILRENFVAMTDYDTEQNLRFYFGHQQTVEFAIPLLCFYQRQAVPAECEIAINFPCVVRAAKIAPGNKIWGFNAYSHPGEWLRFADWLFVFQYGSNGDVISCREFEAVPDKADKGYLLLGGCARQEVKGLAEVLAQLNRPRGSSDSVGRETFTKWYRETSPTMKYTVEEMVSRGGDPIP
jgi:hypothetical protein